MSHYYIEDITVDPRRKSRVESVHSIQFDRMSNTVYINIDEPQEKTLVRASTQISNEDMDNLCKWWLEGKE